MTRWIAAILALLMAANGLFMLGLPQAWYDAVPGVPLTGLFNPHFVRDIGMAYLTVAGGLAWFAWRPVQAGRRWCSVRLSWPCMPRSMWSTAPVGLARCRRPCATFRASTCRR